MLSHSKTPVNRPKWRAGLAEFRDQEFAQFILDGLEKGLRIGFRRGSVLRQVGHSMLCPDLKVVDEYLRREMCLNQLVKQDKQEARRLGVHLSPMGMIPKKSKPGSWRLITALSTPEGSIMNDGIAKDMSSLTYTSVDLVASRILQLGIKQAYRLVPVHLSIIGSLSYATKVVRSGRAFLSRLIDL